METFLSILKIILVALIGATIALFLNHNWNKYSNNKLLKSLTDTLAALQAKPIITKDDQDQIEYLKGEIYVLNFKCK